MAKTTKFSPWRPDHVLCKVPSNVDLSKAEVWKVGDFTIPPFEDEPIQMTAKDDIIRTPSDHLGLLCWVPLV